MKILLMGDASNYHRALASGLRSHGHDVTVVSDGGKWMNTHRDVDISRPGKGKLSGALHYFRLRNLLKRELRGYDVVQLTGPSFADLRPNRLQNIFDDLKRNNGSIYMTALGSDSLYVKALTGEKPPLRYSEWNLGRERTPWSLSASSKHDEWLSKKLLDYTNHLYSNIDGVVSALYEYHRVVEEVRPEVPLTYGGLPIEMEPLANRKENSKIRIYLAAHKGREAEKGADILFPLVEKFAKKNSEKVEILTPPNMVYSEFSTFLGTNDIVVDQLYGMSPATTALLGMSKNVVPISGAEPEYADFIGEKTPIPLINADPFEPDGFLNELQPLVDNPDELRKMQKDAREFAERHHEASIVAKRFIDFWNSDKK